RRLEEGRRRADDGRRLLRGRVLVAGAALEPDRGARVRRVPQPRVDAVRGAVDAIEDAGLVLLAEVRVDLEAVRVDEGGKLVRRLDAGGDGEGLAASRECRVARIDLRVDVLAEERHRDVARVEAVDGGDGLDQPQVVALVVAQRHRAVDSRLRDERLEA